MQCMHPFFKRRDLELQLGNLGPLQIVTVASRCDPARFVIGRIRDRSEYDRPGDDTKQQSSDEDCKDRHRSDRYDIIPIHSQVALLPTFVLDKTSAPTGTSPFVDISYGCSGSSRKSSPFDHKSTSGHARKPPLLSEHASVS